MYKDVAISLVLPCKNEANALKAVYKKLPKAVDEVIVVNNGSTDETVYIARRFGARIVSETRQAHGIGYGYALSTGIRNATGTIIVCMDGDGSYPASEIPRLVAHLTKKNLDFISCTRFPFRDPKKMSRIRAFGVQVLNILMQVLYGHKIKDSLTGMWVFRKETIRNFTLFEGGWNFSLEIKLGALSNPKVRFAEMHIPYQDREFDSSKQNIFKTGFIHLLYLFTFKLKFLLQNRFVLRQRPLSLSTD